MRLIHYSKKPLVRVVSKPHNDHGCGAYKTPGLWVSVEGDDDWLNWCRNESHGLDGFTCATEIILAPDANVHRLSTARQIFDDFTGRSFGEKRPEWDRSIDWPAIRKVWQGLIIAPYCWARRLSSHTSWYYGWDCASGVIWDAKAIGRLKSIEPPNMAEEKAA